MFTRCILRSLFFFFNDTATTEIYTLSLHDALPISARTLRSLVGLHRRLTAHSCRGRLPRQLRSRLQHLLCKLRSEEHTSELQSQSNLVCRLLLEKKKKKRKTTTSEHLQPCSNRLTH